jgi:hypothetical protein
MRGIVPATCYALPGDQPIDGIPRFRGKGLCALDLGYETLELRDVLDIPAGRTHENGNKSNDERCGVTPVWQQRTVVAADSCTGGIEAPRCARKGRDLLSGGSHVRILVAGG